MWCSKCQADVAAEVSPDNRRIYCAICSTELTLSQGRPQSGSGSEARELLERWTAEEFLNPSGGEKTSQIRFDSAHPIRGASFSPGSGNIPRKHFSTVPEGAEAQAPPQSFYPPNSGHPGSEPSQSYTYFHQPHAIAPPHFDIQALVGDQQKPKTNWISLCGQLLAYAGVALLTVGTAMLLSGYFGGPETYTPTGWLVATVGQMLLFLGVVTLVSSGMEQTSNEVSRRVDTLGKHILRIEKSSYAMRGMSVGAGAPAAGTHSQQSPPPSGPAQHPGK